MTQDITANTWGATEPFNGLSAHAPSKTFSLSSEFTGASVIAGSFEDMRALAHIILEKIGGLYEVRSQMGSHYGSFMDFDDGRAMANELARRFSRKAFIVYGPAPDNPHADEKGCAVLWDTTDGGYAP